MKKRILVMNTLPGQPTDGSGKVCIHLFVVDPKGPFKEPMVAQLDKIAADNGDQRLICAPARGRLACDPKRTVAPVERKGVTTLTLRTGDPRAATCPKCITSDDYKKMMKVLSDAQNQDNNEQQESE